MSAAVRARSESPAGVMLEPPPLFNATLARKQAEQDSILLANRIRLLRAEEDKAKKKIRETERRTREILEARQRNEERRVAKEAAHSYREAGEAELRLLRQKDREEQHRKILASQRSILDQKERSSASVKQEREAHKQHLQAERQRAEAEVMARADRVRREQIASERRRARSEGARLESAHSYLREKMEREDKERRDKLVLIDKMEKEEAELIVRLQQTQERHRSAYARLEDVVRHGSSVASMPGTPGTSGISSVSSLDGYQQEARPAAKLPSMGTSRPPRPKLGTPGASAPFAGAPASLSPSDTAAMPSRRPSVPRTAASSSVPGLVNKFPASKAGKAAGRPDNVSICSTTSDGGRCTESVQGSGQSTPSSALPQLTYKTIDGLELDIPTEEEFNLDQLLNGT